MHLTMHFHGRFYHLQWYTEILICNVCHSHDGKNDMKNPNDLKHHLERQSIIIVYIYIKNK